MAENFTRNAAIHKLPACPECDAAESRPCVSTGGHPRAPHAVRAKLARGELVLGLKPGGAVLLLERVAQAVRAAAASTGEIAKEATTSTGYRGGYHLEIVVEHRRFRVAIDDLGDAVSVKP